MPGHHADGSNIAVQIYTRLERFDSASQASNSITIGASLAALLLKMLQN